MDRSNNNSLFQGIAELMGKIKETKKIRSAMKTRKAIHKKYLQKTLMLMGVIVLVSCGHHKDEYHSVVDKFEDLGKDYQGTSISSEVYLQEYHTIEISEDGHTFLIPERKSELQSYKCSECHSKPVAQLKGKEFQKAHWNIKLEHANSEAMNCLTCHNAKDMDHLKSLTGNAIDFNYSYKVCNQCHSKQFEDWKGGAHGKRIESWAPPRASFTCVNCHNPHKPGFESKWPAKFNTQKRQDRD